MMSYDDTIKIIVLGDHSVKISLTKSFISGFFLEDLKLTMGVDFYSKTTNFNDKKIKLQLWTIGGEERFRFLLHQYCKDFRGGLFVFDIADSSSIAHIDDWLSEIRKGIRTEEIFPILVVGILLGEGNERQVSTEEGIKIAKSRNLNGYFECNPKTGENVGKVFDELTRLILANEEYQTPIKMKKYEEFIVYDLKNTGYPTKLNINPEELQYHSNPKNVLIIIHKDLNRIFIWKGARSSERKRFISARIAQELKNDLIKDALYHRCKIVSINQGEELQEFLNAFRLESMEVTDPLPDGSFKLCIFGDDGVGKTTLIHRYATKVFDEDIKMTVGADFYEKDLEIDGKKIIIRIWVFGGEQRFKVLLPSFAKGADGGIFMFDITRYTSVKNIDDWLSIFEKNVREKEIHIPIIMVGGKLDLQEKRSVETEDAVELSEKYNLQGYFECSPKIGVNVEEIFEYITRKMMEFTGLL